MPAVEDGSGFIVLSVPQAEREYSYPAGHLVYVQNVVKIKHQGGYEYLETLDGVQHVIAPGWHSMRGTPASWVFRP